MNLGLGGLEIAVFLDLGINGLRFRDCRISGLRRVRYLEFSKIRDLEISEIRGLPNDPKRATKRSKKATKNMSGLGGVDPRFYRQV